MKKVRVDLVLVVTLLVSVGLVFSGVTLAEEKQGGKLNVAIGADPEALDPLEMSSAPAAMVMLHTMEPLFEMTPEGDIEPLLAKGYEVSEDGLEYDILLEEGVTFHDGTKFDAEAVKFNLDRFQDAIFSFLIEEIVEVEVVDDYTVRLHLDRPFAPMMAHLSHDFIGMASPTAVEKYGEDFATNPVGTGPFEFVEWTRGEEIVLEKFDEYWGENAYLDAVTFSIVPEDSTRVVMVETGEADAAMFVPPKEMERLQDVPDVDVVQATSVRTIYLGFNHTKEPFDEPKVRRALNYAVDNKAIVEQVMDGAGRPSDAPISPDIFGYSQQDLYEYDPEKAEQLLEEAGYEDGLEVTLHHPVGRYMMDETVAQAVQAQLDDVGVDVKLQTLEWATYLEFMNVPPEESEHEMYMLGWGTVTGDADYGLYPLFHTEEWVPEGSNRSYTDYPRVDELLDEARVTPDSEKRKGLYEEAIETLWDKAPWVFLHSEVQINAVREGVEGLVHHPREYIVLKNAYLAEE
ncbi:MAG: glutathione ABC transporter substrate-binding protein [Candidatus Acetothermia bacterium]